MVTVSRASIIFLMLCSAIAAGVAGFLLGLPMDSPLSPSYVSHFSTGSHVGTSHKSDSASEPDWTIAPCSLWADTEYPKLPPYTITTACAFQDADGTWKIDYAVDDGSHLAADPDLGQLPTR